MRQSNQKNRMRGRGRKPGNPLSRNYESNGPDVKIRGNASHIADKYTTLARDAAAAGDVVMSENYLQHAEHYNRIIAAANAANQQRNEEQSAAGRGDQPDVSGYDGDDSDSDGDSSNNRGNGRNNDRRVQAKAEDGEAGASESGEDQSEKKPRREPRNRRPRRNAMSEDGNGTAAMNGKGANGSAGHGDNDASENISSDAAKLPGSLIGAVEEKTVAETASED